MKELRQRVQLHLDRRVLSDENRRLRQRLDKSFGFEGIVGHSRTMEELLEKYPEEDCRIIFRGPAEKLADAWLQKYKTDLGTKKPIERYDNLPEYDAAEMEGDILIILWGNGMAEIRGGVQ